MAPKNHKPVCKLRMGKRPLFKPKGCTTANGVKVRGKFISAKKGAKPVVRETAGWKKRRKILETQEESAGPSSSRSKKSQSQSQSKSQSTHVSETPESQWEPEVGPPFHMSLPFSAGSPVLPTYSPANSSSPSIIEHGQYHPAAAWTVAGVASQRSGPSDGSAPRPKKKVKKKLSSGFRLYGYG